jgi:protein CLEC16A
LIVFSCRTPKPVKVQILQTLSIFFQNLQNDTIIFYLLSNNHLNELITHRFDCYDDELMSYYISFLKALSLRLNADTVNFFFNPGKVPEFPLLTEALRFFNHEDHMVRVAVRMLTLNVYKIEDQEMRSFVATRTAVPYFSNIVWDVLKRYRAVDQARPHATRICSISTASTASTPFLL